jgi:hypothetical protein
MVEAEAMKKAGPGSTKSAATREEGIMVSDIMQHAAILHCAVFVYEGRQRRAAGLGSSSSTTSSSSGGNDSGSSSSSSSWAPKEAKRLLQQLQFPLDTAQHYCECVRMAMPEGGPAYSHLNVSRSRLQDVINMRMIGLEQPDGLWATRYTGYMAAAATAAAAARPAVSPDPVKISVQHVLCPGFHPAQLAYLILEHLCVLGLGQDRLTCDLAGLTFLSMMLDYAQRQVWSKVPAAEAPVLQKYAEGCVEHVWLSLGKQLQRAAGVAEAELEGDGSQPADAAAAGSSSSDSRDEGISRGRVWKWSCLQMQQQECSWCGTSTATASLAPLPYTEVRSSAFGKYED